MDGAGRKNATLLVGADRCKGGWVVARGDGDLTTVRLVIVESIEPIVEVVQQESAIACLDVPIGLADDGPRRCDLEARRFLGQPRGSSVFPAPCRAALDARTYQEASHLNFDASGRKLSRQSFGILPAIREVDQAMTPELQDRIREGHPEVTFAVLSGRERGLEHPKKSQAGREERLAVLSQHLPEIDIEAERKLLGPRHLDLDDMLDALACLATASRIAAGEERVFPANGPDLDAHGLRMEIVA